MKFKFLFVLLFIFSTKNIFPFFDSYKARNAYLNKDYKKAKDILEKQQIDNPNDAKINYNLGSAFYKLNDFENAKSNFERAVQYSGDNKELKERSYFNWGNSFYKNCLRILGLDWEKKDIEDKVLDEAINQAQRSIEKFDNTLVLNKENEKAKINKQVVEKLLESLQQKKQQQQQDKQDQKNQDQDKQDQDKNKDQQNKQDKNQQDDQKSKQDNQDNKDDSKDQKNQQGQKDKDQQEQGDQENKQESQEHGEQPDSKEQEKEGDDGSKDSESDEQNGEKNDLDKKQSGEEEQGVDQKDKHDTTSPESEGKEDNQSDKEGKQQEQKMQETGFAEQKDFEKELKEKGMRVILDKLQDEESKLQKVFIMQKSKGAKKQLNDKQKPW